MSSVPTHAGGVSIAASSSRPKLDSRPNPGSIVLFLLLLAGGLGYAGYSLFSDVIGAGASTTTWLPFGLLVVALLIALGFEFVNGFHDTA
ncbi:MAG: inorganic phosphate transporter, partial [Burkholderiaceae bacterium]